MSDPGQNHPPENDSDPGAILSAWLDGQLSETERGAFEARLAQAPAVRIAADEFKRMDVLLRDWYAAKPETPAVHAASSAPAPIAPVLVGRQAWAWKALIGAGLVAAALVLVVAPWALRERAFSLAEEAVKRAGQTLREAPGLRVEFTATETKKGPGGAEETRNAKGEIRFGPLLAHPPLFWCEIRWAATREDPEILRRWGQTETAQWLQERQGGNYVATSVSNIFDPEHWDGPSAFGEERTDGSPVDPRTRQAVEGLAALLRGFQKEGFKKWLGCRWIPEGEGGSGDQAYPWTFRTEPFPGAGEARDRIEWVLRLRTGEEGGDGGEVREVEFEELISEAKTGKRLSRLQVAYRIEPRKEPWPANALEAENMDPVRFILRGEKNE